MGGAPSRPVEQPRPLFTTPSNVGMVNLLRYIIF